jgi:hypothetical protein
MTPMRDGSQTPLTRAAVAYAWRQLARRAGVTGGDPLGTGFEGLRVPVSYGRAEQADKPCIVVLPCDQRAWRALLEREPDSLDWLPASQVAPPGAKLPNDDPLPVLFWAEGYEHGDRPLASLRADGSIVFYVDIIATTFFMLSRWEETIVATRDQHGRFPGTASVAYRQGFLDRPIVDEYALILRQWLRILLPSWEPERRSFSVKLSHDVDRIRYFARGYTAILTLGGDLVKRRDPARAWQTILGVVLPEKDPFYAGIHFLAQLSQQCGLGDDAFYFMATGPEPQESDYDLRSPLVERCIKTLQDQGFEIGLHAGYHTFNDLARLRAEKARLEDVIKQAHIGGRQHFLRFQAPLTWRHWEQAGLAYDSTVTYADQEGFRCGTCHPFRPFDVELNRELGLWERPLIVMEGTLATYRGLTCGQGKERILELARRCKQVEGTFSLLWHNSSLSGRRLPWAEMYQEVVKELATMCLPAPPSLTSPLL